MATIRKAQNGKTLPFATKSKEKSSGRKYPSGDLLPSSPNYKGPKGKPSSKAPIKELMKKAKHGTKVKKAQAGDRLLKSVDRRLGGKKDVFLSDDGKYRTKYKYRSDNDTTPSRVMNRRTLKGFLTGAKRGAPPAAKTGAKMKKCKYGCK